MDRIRLESLLKQVGLLVDHQKEMLQATGENFNVFSVLGLETKEDVLHSALIAELLNSTGSHGQGTAFLSIFIRTLKEVNPTLSIDSSTTSVQIEKSVGRVDVVQKSGGRIDIYLQDIRGSCVSIENKIYAGDQDCQIERYVNYRRNNNSIYYLTLLGKEPSEGSKGTLKSGEDYFLLSYREHILVWLDECVRISAELPVLRETLRQYRMTIQRLTNKMDNKHEAKLERLMLENFEEASYVAAKFHDACHRIAEGVRKGVVEKLEMKFENKYAIELGGGVGKTYSQIWVKAVSGDMGKFSIGLESFSGKGHYDGDMFVGIHCHGGSAEEFPSKLPEFNKLSDWWLDTNVLNKIDDMPVNFSSPSFLKKLNSDQKFTERVVQSIASNVIEYVDKYGERVFSGGK